MIPTGFEYERATSVADAVARLRASNGAAKLIAGGHSLVPLMKLRLSEPGRLIDIARIPELCGIRQVGDAIEIGAATVHHDVATSPLIATRCPMLAEAAAEIGDPQVRNRGTLGGSLAHADPSADYPAVILVLNATIHIVGPGGERVVQAATFFKDLLTVDLDPQEVIVSVRFKPVVSAGYAKLHQRASHYAIVGVAGVLDIQGGVVRSACVAVTGASTHAMRLSNVEHALAGQPLNDESIHKAASIAGAGVAVVNADVHASEEYRRAMIPVFTKRALEKARARSSA
ncbi:MAG: xanthine dehydrogenase family protein subunit M [Acidimicrobiia bacterium]|nr:xanthine dehydrogenase family protein subunit M [Acidimicrobiia bacterium]